METLRQARGGLDFSQISLADLGASPSAIAAQRQEHRLLLAALRKVPIDAQILLELHYWESLSGPELGVIFDLPEGTVRSRLHRAKEQLRQALAALASGSLIIETTVEALDEWARRVRAHAELEHSALRPPVLLDQMVEGPLGSGWALSGRSPVLETIGATDGADDLVQTTFLVSIESHSMLRMLSVSS